MVSRSVATGNRRAVHRPVDLHHRLAAESLEPGRVLGAQRQRVELDPVRVGRGDDVVLVQLRTRHPALVAGVADAAEDRHRARSQQVAQCADQRDVEQLPVSETGQFSKVVDKLGHARFGAEGKIATLRLPRRRP